MSWRNPHRPHQYGKAVASFAPSRAPSQSKNAGEPALDLQRFGDCVGAKSAERLGKRKWLGMMRNLNSGATSGSGRALDRSMTAPICCPSVSDSAGKQMALSSKERQQRYIAKLKAGAVSNDTAAAAGAAPGVTDIPAIVAWRKAPDPDQRAQLCEAIGTRKICDVLYGDEEFGKYLDDVIQDTIDNDAADWSVMKIAGGEASQAPRKPGGADQDPQSRQHRCAAGTEREVEYVMKTAAKHHAARSNSSGCPRQLNAIGMLSKLPGWQRKRNRGSSSG